MARALDIDAIEAVVLDDEAFDCAIEAASESNIAGDDEQAQLKAAVQAYLWAIEQRRALSLIREWLHKGRDATRGGTNG